MRNILIVGAGQLGSRHLQGALTSENALDITIVDPFQDSLGIARERASQISMGNKESKVTYLQELPTNQLFDICINSTTAQVRAEVTRKLLAANQVKQIIFEKILFQKLADYNDVATLLKDNSTVGWVNCPRRVFPSYGALKQTIDPSASVQMEVRGHSWGMACNSVHFLDLFSYLIGDSALALHESNLDNHVIESKRSGFYETTGKLSFTSDVHSLTIESGSEHKPELVITIKNGDTRHDVNEINGSWKFMTTNDVETKKYKPIFQSQLTGRVIDELIATNECSLTPFSESCDLHIPFIAALVEHFSFVFDKELDACPIT